MVFKLGGVHEGVDGAEVFYIKMLKKMILTNKQHAEDLFGGQNTQHS